MYEHLWLKIAGYPIATSPLTYIRLRIRRAVSSPLFLGDCRSLWQHPWTDIMIDLSKWWLPNPPQFMFHSHQPPTFLHTWHDWSMGYILFTRDPTFRSRSIIWEKLHATSTSKISMSLPFHVLPHYIVSPAYAESSESIQAMISVRRLCSPTCHHAGAHMFTATTFSATRCPAAPWLGSMDF